MSKCNSVAIQFLCVVMTVFALATGPRALAQNQNPPKYLYVTNVELKPGHGEQFAKLQHEIVTADRTAKAPGFYLGTWSITGDYNRVLFMQGFSTYGELEKDHIDLMSKPAAAEVINKNFAAMGEFEVSARGSIYEYKNDLSLRAGVDLEKARGAVIAVFHVREGQQEAFERTVKEYVKGFETSVPDAHWATFAKSYGEGSGTTYLYISSTTSLAEMDALASQYKAFADKVGAEVVAMQNAQWSAAIDSSEWNVVYFGTEISYVPEKWLSDSPDFWGKK